MTNLKSPNGKSKKRKDSEGDYGDKLHSLKNHKLTPTCLCVDSKDRYAFTGSKDGSILKWNLKTKEKEARVDAINRLDFDNDEKLRECHHHKHINCIAISSDDKFLATGGWDKLIRIYSPKDLTWIHTFSKHRQEVTALAFRIDYSLLYSGSADRSVMLWTLEDEDNRCFVDDLYGHESPITSIDILKRERVLTSGGRDQTVRVWKIVEQAQTVFESKHESVDIARYIDDKSFVSGGEDGSISVWTLLKRKPIYNLPNAHPIKGKDSDEMVPRRFDQAGLKPWISALATFNLVTKTAQKKHINGKKRRKLDDGDDLVTGGVEDDSDASTEDDDSSSGEEIVAEEVNDGPRRLALIASGSCNEEIRVWLLTKSGSKYDMKLIQTISCLGFVNDLRFTKNGDRLVAICGPEHKFGRWWRLPGVKTTIGVFDINKPEK